LVKAETRARYRGTGVEEVHRRVGRRIRAARLAQGLSLADLGGEDFSRSFLSLVEQGRSCPSLSALAILARRLRLPLGYFVDDSSSRGSRLGEECGVDLIAAALSYSASLRERGDLEGAYNYAHWAASSLGDEGATTA